VVYRPQLHLGADHGYALPDRDVYHKQAANRDWELMFAMFRAQLAPPV
jgi:carboxymethylenebutenolidase